MSKATVLAALLIEATCYHLASAIALLGQGGHHMHTSRSNVYLYSTYRLGQDGCWPEQA